MDHGLKLMFCEKCGSILQPTKKGGKNVFVCARCGKRGKGEGKVVEKATEQKEKIIIIDKKEETMPKMETACPKCNNGEAFFFVSSLRSSSRKVWMKG